MYKYVLSAMLPLKKQKHYAIHSAFEISHRTRPQYPSGLILHNLLQLFGEHHSPYQPIA